MVEIPGADNNTYKVPSWTTFKVWGRRVAIGYIILALACAAGVYGLGKKNKDNIIDSINVYAVQSCVNSRTTLIKYNDLVDAIVNSRIVQLQLDVAAGNKAKVSADQIALSHYKKDFLPIPTDAVCNTPILKR